MTVTSSLLDVPGATLYHEVQGSGPLLLLIPGGPQDASVFRPLAGHLADRYTVVALDPRGNSRSVVEGAPADLDVDQHADDAVALIAHLGAGPAFVLGTSGGGQVALSLAARHPQAVRAVIAHEPATTMALPDPSATMANEQAVVDTFHREGVDAAMAQFFGQAGLDGDFPEGDVPDEESGDTPGFEPSPEEMEDFTRISANFEYWLAHGLLPLSRYEPDLETLRAGSPSIVVGIGEASAGQEIHDIGMALAAKLGIEPVTFPGDHTGFETHAAEFAEVVHTTLTTG